MPNDTDKIRVVAEAFMGWKPEQMCGNWCPHANHWWNESGGDKHSFWMGPLTHHPKEIPPLDLLAPAGAWALESALSRTCVVRWQCAFVAKSGEFGAQLDLYERDGKHVSVVLVNGNRERALLDAAYQLATKEQR